MTDDPHDSTWIPPTRKVVWCPVHKEDKETCNCYRSLPSGSSVILSVAVGVIVVLIISALLVL